MLHWKRFKLYSRSSHRRAYSVLLRIVTVILVAGFSTSVSAAVIKRGDILETFDPYGESDTHVSSEADAMDDLRPRLMLSLSYGYTYRTNFPGENIVYAEEQMHMWTAGVHYMPWKFLFVGAALPVATAKFDAVARTLNVDEGTNSDGLPRYDWTGGFGDVATYVGSELPWIPLTFTALLMWPTGDIEKGMGTGQFSYGFTADFSWTFGKVRTSVGGFYFVLLDPEVTVYESDEYGNLTDTDEKEVLDLPNTFGASLSAMMPISKFRLGVGFRWSRRTLITWDTVHVYEPSIKMVWPVTPWFATVLNAGVEVYPTFALVPTLSMVWSI